MTQTHTKTNRQKKEQDLRYQKVETYKTLLKKLESKKRCTMYEKGLIFHYKQKINRIEKL